MKKFIRKQIRVGLSPTEIYLLCYYLVIYNGVCKRSVRKIEEETSLTFRTIYRINNLLEEKGVIEIHRGDNNTPSTYIVKEK